LDTGAFSCVSYFYVFFPWLAIGYLAVLFRWKLGHTCSGGLGLSRDFAALEGHSLLLLYAASGIVVVMMGYYSVVLQLWRIGIKGKVCLLVSSASAR
jgi:hypothetical protein